MTVRSPIGSRPRADLPDAPRRRRRSAVAAVVAAIVAGLLLAWAPPASAHAVVVSSSPSDGERLTSSPAAVSIQFSEAISADLGGLRVVSSDGKSVDAGPDTVSGPTLSVPLEPDLPAGTYVATYRVISADGHPVKGALVFAVGDAPASGIDAGSYVVGGSSDRSFEVLGAIARFLTYLGALTAAGLAFFLAFLHDEGAEAGLLARIVRGAAVVAVIGAFGTLGTQAALATGRGWDAVFDPSVLHDVLTETLDLATGLLLAGLLILLVSLEARRRGSRQTLAFYGGLATCTSFLFWGHTLDAPDRWLALVSNGVHVIAAALWLGGLVGLAVVLHRRTRATRATQSAAATDGGGLEVGSGDGTGGGLDGDLTASSPGGSPDPDTAHAVGSSGSTLVADPRAARAPVDQPVEQLHGAAAIVARFSTTAAVSIIALWLAGGALAWIEVGSLDALTSTTYGRLVLSKVVVVAVIGAFALYNRARLVPEVVDETNLAVGLADDTTEPSDVVRDALVEDPDLLVHARDEAHRGLVRLSRTVVVEALLIVVVLGVTSVLVNTTPGRSAVVSQGVANQTLPITTTVPGSTLNLVVAPAQAGVRNSLHLSYSDPQGRPVTIAGPVKVELSLPDQDIGPISRDALPGGPGHYLLDTDDITIPGVWTITVISRLSEFDQQRTTFSVKVR
jgi:copper transport protein